MLASALPMYLFSQLVDRKVERLLIAVYFPLCSQ
jgi:hypothetical protein